MTGIMGHLALTILTTVKPPLIRSSVAVFAVRDAYDTIRVQKEDLK